MYASSAAQELLSKAQINEKVISYLHTENQVFDWNEASDAMVASALLVGDSIAAIGYKPADIGDIRGFMHTIDITDPAWLGAKEKIQNVILEETNTLLGTELKLNALLPYEENETLPYFFIKIMHPELVTTIRALDEIRYFEPAGYTGLEDENRSDEGCADYSESLDGSDYTIITPSAIQSWHQLEHDVDAAWTKCDKGEGIWVSLMDTGISEDNPKYNGEFDEEDSNGRTLEKNGYYQNDGWADQCGHGTAMGGLIAAPRGTSDSPAGVAYRANLISNRVTNNVVINASDEINGLGDALDVAADDNRVSIISISLGDVFSHGPVEDGIINAYNQEKLIFAAAGTSTTFTNWYGVIFPANMPEAVAVTGAIEGTSFDECDVCHKGNEVLFTVYMERSGSGNKAVTTTNDNVNDAAYRGYVGGSSAATATMAGIAAMAWGNNQDLSRDQLLDRLIQTSSLYPNKDDDFGWGAINACDAVDSTFSLPCASSLSNEVTMQLTSITFPPVDDTGDEAEWVLKIAGKSYYFDVPESGASGHPTVYLNEGACDNAPVEFDLGVTTCGQGTISIEVETHEDDGTGSDCDWSSFFDSDQTITTEVVDLGQNEFIQSTSNGDFVFQYTLYCAPTFIAGLSDDTPKCPGDVIHFEATPAGESNYEFFNDLDKSGTIDPGEQLQNGPSNTYSSSAILDGDIIGVVITASNGCIDTTSAAIALTDPMYSGTNKLVGIESGNADYESNLLIESEQLIEATAIVDYDSQDTISMEAGFEVQQGAQFEAFIDGCNDGNGGQNIDETSDPEDN